MQALDQTEKHNRLWRFPLGTLAVSLTILVWSCQSIWRPGWAAGANLKDLAENLLLIVAITAIVTAGEKAVRLAERLIRTAAQNKFAILAVILTGFVVALSMCLLDGVPRPYTHDEFSYLLGADTFAHGRLTNPPHPLWRFFETIHVLQQPTYASKYLPAQAAILAVGQLLGNPIVGAWISTGLLVGALFWMLKQWMPAQWALLGCALVAFHPELVAWSHDYWGGQAAAAGGALLLGAARRIADRPNPGHAIVAAVGISLLANSRAYEGLILTLSITALIYFRARASKVAFRDMLRRAVAPAAVVLMLTALGMAFYNYRVTGSPLTMPYQLYERTYNPVPIFLWQKLRVTPPYNHWEIQRIWNNGPDVRVFYDEARSLDGFIKLIGDRLQAYSYSYFLGIVPLLGLILAMIVTKAGREARSIGMVVTVCFIALFAESWEHSQYFAPAAGACLLFSLMVLRRLRAVSWNGFPFGLALTRTLVIVVIITFAYFFRLASQKHSEGWYDQRALLVESLKKQGGKNLILVRYSPNYEPEVEWVFNSADIDSSQVVWAHDMGEAQNKELLAYFKDRTVWLLSVGLGSCTFTPYTGSAGPTDSVRGP